ncbi:hypothetical protein CHARACLAT_018426, partial [Characodon lateralis]|nr:hypothetical protein [Characodon lateralis]
TDSQQLYTSTARNKNKKTAGVLLLLQLRWGNGLTSVEFASAFERGRRGVREQEWLSSGLRKHLPNWKRNKATKTGILTVCVCVLSVSAPRGEETEIVLPTAAAAIPVSFHICVESRKRSE